MEKLPKKSETSSIKNTNDCNCAANSRMEIKILKAIEVSKKEAQVTGQKGGDLASGSKANKT
jgi:hypothetical protein